MSTQLLSTSPAKEFMNVDKNSKFWDKIANRYAKSPVKDEAAYQKKLEITRKYLSSDSSILEIGCGTGSTAITHAPFVKHVHATDISGNMIEIAKTKAKRLNIQNLHFERVSIDDLAVPNESVDVVLAMSILHLVEDRRDVMEKIYAALKPGGVFISSTICLGDSMKFLKYIVPMGHRLGFLPLVKFFTKEAFLSSIVDMGFAIEHEWLPGKNKAIFVVARKPA